MPTSFHGGPAEGQKLMLKRAPKFLRVVEHLGDFDALDNLEDIAAPEERIHVYKVEGEVGTCHINRGGGRGGWYVIATYRFLEHQPDEDEIRSNDDWQDWCIMNQHLL